MNGAQPDGLRGRRDELAHLEALASAVRQGRSEALVVSGEAGVGKSALLARFEATVGPDLDVRRMVASESEMELAYAGLQFLCAPMMAAADQLAVPQRTALETAFGLRVGASPNPLLVGLATLSLLTEAAAGGGLLCIVDDAHWLDRASASAIAFAARRLGAEGVGIVLVMRAVTGEWADLPRLTLHGLGDDDARALLREVLAAPIDPRVHDQILTEARGNPLALRELPRSMTPTAITRRAPATPSMPLESRIEASVLAELDALAGPTRLVLLLAAADPTGDPGLLWRAGTRLGIAPEHVERAGSVGALTIGTRVSFRHPLVRSAIYGSASAEDRRRVHAALADATDQDRDPDRRAWHRANASLLPDDEVAAELERSANRARQRGGAAAAAAFLERAAALTPDDVPRADRLIAAAESHHDSGAPGDALRLLDSARDLRLTARQQALMGRIRARSEYAIRRDHAGARRLLAAAQGLDGIDRALARDTYIEALAAAVYGGRLSDADAVAEVAGAILEATQADQSGKARDLILRGQALLAAKGQQAAMPTLRRALQAYLHEPLDALELHWMWFASRAAQDLWDADGMRVLAARQVELVRHAGIVAVLPIALSLQMVAQTLGGDLDAAEASCDEIDALRAALGHQVPPTGRMFLAAYRGQAAEAEALAAQVRADGHARREGYSLSAANFAEAILYNGLGRYDEALAAGRRELPYTHELNHAMRALLEVVEAGSRVGELALAEEACRRLDEVTRPLESDYALGVLEMARAQLCPADEAEELYRRAIARFEAGRIPILIGRTRLLYGEALRRQRRRLDAREQLRAAHRVLSQGGLAGFAERAARELAATGETVRRPTGRAVDDLTEQEMNVARLAREGLTNRDIGARLFISARTAEYHLHKVFVKLGITSRSELRTVLTGVAEPA